MKTNIVHLNNVQRYGYKLIDITYPYSGDRLLCYYYKGKFISFKMVLGECEGYSESGKRPRYLSEWQKLSTNKALHK